MWLQLTGPGVVFTRDVQTERVTAHDRKWLPSDTVGTVWLLVTAMMGCVYIDGPAAGVTTGTVLTSVVAIRGTDELGKTVLDFSCSTHLRTHLQHCYSHLSCGTSIMPSQGFSHLLHSHCSLTNNSFHLFFFFFRSVYHCITL